MNPTDRALFTVIAILLFLVPLSNFLKPDTVTVTTLSPVTVTVANTTTITETVTGSGKLVYLREGFVKGWVSPAGVSSSNLRVNSVYFGKWGSKVIVGVNITVSCNSDGPQTPILKIDDMKPIDAKTALSIVGDFPVSIDGRIFCNDPTWFFFVMPEKEKYLLSFSIEGSFGREEIDLTPFIQELVNESTRSRSQP